MTTLKVVLTKTTPVKARRSPTESSHDAFASPGVWQLKARLQGKGAIFGDGTDLELEVSEDRIHDGDCVIRNR